MLPGQDHAGDVARNLSGIASQVRVIMLPDLPLKGDVADWIAAGGTATSLAELVTNAPAWTQSPKLRLPSQIHLPATFLRCRHTMP